MAVDKVAAGCEFSFPFEVFVVGVSDALFIFVFFLFFQVYIVYHEPVVSSLFPVLSS